MIVHISCVFLRSLSRCYALGTLPKNVHQVVVKLDACNKRRKMQKKHFCGTANHFYEKIVQTLHPMLRQFFFISSHFQELVSELIGSPGGEQIFPQVIKQEHVEVVWWLVDGEKIDGIFLSI